MHISKTGGTTMRVELPKLIGRKWCGCKFAPYLCACANGDHNLSALAEAARKKRCNLISLECPRSMINWVFPDGRAWPEHGGVTIVMVRNPINHWLSVVKHASKRVNSSDQAIIDMSAMSFVHVSQNWSTSFWNLSHGMHDPRNMQTRWLGPRVDRAVRFLAEDSTLVLVHEFYDASICMMAVAVNTWRAIRDKCHCNGQFTSASNVVPAINAAARHKSLAGKRTRGYLESLDPADMTAMTGWLSQDFLLYAAALNIFHADVAAAERSVGQRFLCAGGEDIASVPWRRWDARPSQFEIQ